MDLKYVKANFEQDTNEQLKPGEYTVIASPYHGNNLVYIRKEDGPLTNHQVLELFCDTQAHPEITADVMAFWMEESNFGSLEEIANALFPESAKQEAIEVITAGIVDKYFRTQMEPNVRYCFKKIFTKIFEKHPNLKFDIPKYIKHMEDVEKDNGDPNYPEPIITEDHDHYKELYTYCFI